MPLGEREASRSLKNNTLFDLAQKGIFILSFFLCFFQFLFYIGVLLTYNVVIVSGV